MGGLGRAPGEKSGTPGRVSSTPQNPVPSSAVCRHRCRSMPLHAVPCSALSVSTRYSEGSSLSRNEQVSGSSPLVGSIFPNPHPSREASANPKPSQATQSPTGQRFESARRLHFSQPPPEPRSLRAPQTESGDAVAHRSAVRVRSSAPLFPNPHPSREASANPKPSQATQSPTGQRFESARRLHFSQPPPEPRSLRAPQTESGDAVAHRSAVRVRSSAPLFPTPTRAAKPPRTPNRVRRRSRPQVSGSSPLVGSIHPPHPSREASANPKPSQATQSPTGQRFEPARRLHTPPPPEPRSLRAPQTESGDAVAHRSAVRARSSAPYTPPTRAAKPPRTPNRVSRPQVSGSSPLVGSIHPPHPSREASANPKPSQATQSPTGQRQGSARRLHFASRVPRRPARPILLGALPHAGPGLGPCGRVRTP